MNWKAYYENIAYDVKTRGKIPELTKDHQNTLALPQQIVEIYKSRYQLASALHDEALTKLLAYGRIFIVTLGKKRYVIDEYTNNAIFRKTDETLYYLEFCLHKKRPHEQKLIDYTEKHIFQRDDAGIRHQLRSDKLDIKETVLAMPQEFALEISGKKGVPCYYMGQALIGEINALYQKIMHYYELEDYVFLQVVQKIINESQLLRIQLQALYYLVGVMPFGIESDFPHDIPLFNTSTSLAVAHVAQKVLDFI